MHEGDWGISCADCHGGHINVAVPPGISPSDPQYLRFKEDAHPDPRLPELWRFAANPRSSSAATLRESADYIRFVNPGDLRAARVACGACHGEGRINPATTPDIIANVETSMMSHGAMLWGAALYNNGSINRKDPVYGERYGSDGRPGRILANPSPSDEQIAKDGLLPSLYPLPRWEVTQTGNVLRVFERGGRRRPVLGVPDPAEEPGRPDVKLSVRGPGTDVRTDPVFIGLQKTRLFDPTLNLVGTNDHPGDYRASGCSACHVVYANDRSPVHSGRWAGYGNLGQSFSKDSAVNPSGVTNQPRRATDLDPSPSRKSGQPISHKFVRHMPTSTCISCHIHPGTNVVNSYLGFMWWDNETDGRFMYPKQQQYPTAAQEFDVHQRNPEGSAVRGLWSNLYPSAVSHAGYTAGENFLERIVRLNPFLTRTQFADFHSHGWVFRAVFKQDRQGYMLDHAGKRVENVSAAKMREAVENTSHPDEPPKQRDGLPVHLKDIHLEKGMHCADCHFSQDVHGDGNLYGETRAAVMVTCEDCHGSAEKPAAVLRWLKGDGTNENDLLTAFTGNAADTGTRATRLARNQRIIDRHFGVENDVLVQKGVVPRPTDDPRTGKPIELVKGQQISATVAWYPVQVADTISPTSPWANAETRNPERVKLARFAHSVRRDGKTWGTVPAPDNKDPKLALAHGGDTAACAQGRNSVSCYACHSSWNTSCFGCHLPQRANQRRPMLHNEGAITRNYTNYNYQTLRDDVYMLGIDSTVNGRKVVPIRSACAVLVSSQDSNRQWVYTQQQTVSAEGFSGTAFSPYFPHTVRSAETKQCTDCHLADSGDNNAIVAQLLLQGTNSVNFIGRFAWVGLGKGGLQAVAVTERDEPQAVIGSTLHELAYPDYYNRHDKGGLELREAYGHEGTVLDLQLRGEYLYAACGPEGFIAYDVANIDNKGFSERIITAPVSPLGQRLFVDSKYATGICSPSTMAIDPSRDSKQWRRPENEEGPIHPLYAYLYLTDREEGLIVVGNRPGGKRNKAGVATLLDGDPENNFLRRARKNFNPDGVLKGARHMALHGTYGYVSCDAGVVVIDLDDPLRPVVVKVINDGVRRPRKVAFQFRYGFVVDADGIKVINVTDPKSPTLVGGATVPLADARDVYVSRTYGYVAAGRQGLVILDLTMPERPTIDQVFNAGGRVNDATAVRVGMTNASMFAYVADGRNGIKVLQLTSPERDPTYLGFSPRPSPRLIAWYKTRGAAIALSEGLDRDRAVDEGGHQLSVFGRRGARPFNLEEQQRLFFQTDASGKRDIYTVSDTPKTAPLDPPASADEQPQPAGRGRGRGRAR